MLGSSRSSEWLCCPWACRWLFSASVTDSNERGSGSAVRTKSWRPDGHWACWYIELWWGFGSEQPVSPQPCKHPSQLEATGRPRQSRAQGCTSGCFKAEVGVEDGLSPPCASEAGYHKEPHKSILGCHQPHPATGTPPCPGFCRGGAPRGSAQPAGASCRGLCVYGGSFVSLSALSS